MLVAMKNKTNKPRITLGDIDRKIDMKFDVIDGRFDAIDDRFIAIDKRFDLIDGRFTVVDDRFDTLKVDLENMMDEKIEGLAIKVANGFRDFGERIDGLNGGVDPLTQRVDNLDQIITE